MTHRGFTLLEILIGLLLAALILQLALRPAIRQAEALTLRGAREEVIALFHRARMEARRLGEAGIRFAEGEDPRLLLPGERIPTPLPLRSRGVEIEIAGTRTTLEVRYGPLGTADFASATLILRRGAAEERLVVSGYGRVRR